MDHKRPTWDEYFIGIAKAVSARADCSRAQHGCVLVDQHNHIVGSGYNGSPPGDDRSCLKGDCPRGTDLASLGHTRGNHDYSNCIALHAEQNAVANAIGVLRGATAYFSDSAPCDMCGKLLAAAGIKRIVHPE